MEAILDDYRKAALSTRQRAMMDFAVKLTLEPYAMAEEDVVRLRAAGFDDADLSDIARICAYFNVVSRIAMALGIEGKFGSPLSERPDPIAP